MARLPTPGADDGVWGSVLNDFLAVSHTSSGDIKPSALPDASSSSKGSIQLAGDLSGTASAPIVPGLASKVNTSTTIAAGTGLFGGGDLTTNRALSVVYGTSAGTATEGNDSRITGAMQSTIVDAKGDLITASAADTPSRLGVGTNGQVLTADSTQSTGIRWATQSSPEYYPISAYGFVAVADTISAFSQTSTFEAGVIRIFIPAGRAITAVGVYIQTAGTLGAGGLNGFAVYDDAGTLVQSTPSDDTLYTSIGWRFKDLNAVIPAQASDRFVRVYFSVGGYSGLPYSAYSVVGTDSAPPFIGGYNVPNHRRSVYTSAIGSFPASFTPATFGNPYKYLPLIALG